MADALDLYRFSRLAYRVTVTDIEDTQGIKKAIFMLKKSINDSDDASLLTIEIDETASETGQIINDGSATGTAVLEFVIIETALENVAAVKYYSGVKVILDNDHAHIVPDSIRVTFVNGPMVQDVD